MALTYLGITHLQYMGSNIRFKGGADTDMGLSDRTASEPENIPRFLGL